MFYGAQIASRTPSPGISYSQVIYDAYIALVNGEAPRATLSLRARSYIHVVAYFQTPGRGESALESLQDEWRARTLVEFSSVGFRPRISPFLPVRGCGKDYAISRISTAVTASNPPSPLPPVCLEIGFPRRDGVCEKCPEFTSPRERDSSFFPMGSDDRAFTAWRASFVRDTTLAAPPKETASGL